jgi:hypothetical protein
LTWKGMPELLPVAASTAMKAREPAPAALLSASLSRHDHLVKCRRRRARCGGLSPQQAQPATGLNPIQYAQASIQECHVPHRLRLALRVNQDPVPAVQPDRGVIGVTDATSNVNASVPLHRAPTPSLRGKRKHPSCPVHRGTRAPKGFERC